MTATVVTPENAQRAYEAVKASPEHAREGARWVVDIDSTRFFDHVHHDVLMHRIGQTAPFFAIPGTGSKLFFANGGRF